MRKINVLSNKLIKKLNKNFYNFEIFYIVNLFLNKNLEIEQYLFFSKKKSTFNYYLFLKDLYDKVCLVDQLKRYSKVKSAPLEIKDNELRHKKIWNSVWNLYSFNSFVKERIPRYTSRIKLNKLHNLIKNKKCIDFGCGHGNFLIACKLSKASYCLGIDFGKDSIKYANQIKKRLGFKNFELKYKYSSVYNTNVKSESFDFAIQNGVFHHLKNPEKAFKEVYRVLKKGGYFWSYTAADNGGSYLHFCDLSKKIISRFSSGFVLDILTKSELSQNKIFDIFDIFYGDYLRRNRNYYVKMLKKIGFRNFRMLKGGQPTDFDYRKNPTKDFKNKFGFGENRILFQK